VRHAFGDLVDGPVASCADDQVRAAGDVLARDGARGSGPGRRSERHRVARRAKERRGPFDERAAVPLELACVGIVNQNGLLGGADDDSPGFLVKL
jgi:hypothetical protein